MGLDIMSGQPRLIFFDLPGFFHGINFLVLAIGIYGIGEILWTIETSHQGVEVAQAQLSLRGFADSLRRLTGTAKTMLMGSFLGYFVGILPAAGATPGSLMAYGVAKSMGEGSGLVRQGQRGRGGRPGIREQRGEHGNRCCRCSPSAFRARRPPRSCSAAW